jgi:hypothetical protein
MTILPVPVINTLLVSILLSHTAATSEAQEVNRKATGGAAVKPEPLLSGTTVTGTVRLPDGSVAKQAKVYLRNSPGGSVSLPTHPLETLADAEGRYQFDRVQPGPYRLWAETDRFTSLTKKLGGLRISVKESLPEGESDLAIDLHEGCGYDVSVVDAESGDPIPAARISFGWTDIEREYLSDGSGLARIRNLGADDWYFVVQADGFATEFKKTSKQTLGSVLPLRFTLKPGGRLVGTLRDDSGAALAEAKVSVSPGDVSMSPGYGSTLTDAEGNYSMDGLPIGRPLRLLGRKTGYDYGSMTCAVASSDPPTRADLVCKKRPYGGDVVIEVVAADGSPIAGATLFNRGNSSADTRTAQTDGQGKAKLQNLFSGYAGCNVAIKADGFIPKRLPVVPGTVEQPAEFKVQLERGKTVKGIVLRPDGAPAEKLRVYYNGGERMNELGGRVETDSEGRFVLTGLPDPSTVTVYAPREFAPVRGISVPMDESAEFRIQLKMAGLLRVRAVDAESREPIPEFNVKLGFCEIRKPNDPSTGGISSSLVNPGVNLQGTQKEYRLEGQTVGAPYKVIVWAEGYEPTTVARVEAQAADQAELLDVALQPVRPENYETVAGRLIDADGHPIVGAQVRLLQGSAVPHKLDPFTLKLRQDGWRFYHWGLLSRDDIENRDRCIQYLKSVSDSEGKFEFTGVKKGTPWMELYYFGDKQMSQRYSNLRSRPAEALQQLVLQAEKPSTVHVAVDFKRYPSADSVTLEAEDYTRGPNAVRLAYSSESKTLPADDPKASFEMLPAGRYMIRLSEKPVPTERGGGYRVKSLTSKPIVITEDSELHVAF